ncbi:AraC-like DNA-binding protein [Streptomyces puniciscabiei]|uniref:AraC-like DNA-binding protein n=1 Tax=Streptomyces puniciscabiei TaxID=164348 RepID=A0A542UA44_9ACTN|nr:helix-turn-helix transcriptional regulator [Streptomyces puniciscabiei]TQK95946.1 AraC-like DNA-binding protein [Streptomyces puniciscabiei]
MTAHGSSPGTDEPEIANTTSTTTGRRRRPPAARRPGVRARRRHRVAADRPAAPGSALPGEAPVHAPGVGLTERHRVDLGLVGLSLLTPPEPPAGPEPDGRYADALPRTWRLVFAPRGPLFLGHDQQRVLLESSGVMLWQPGESLRLRAGAPAGPDPVRALVLHLPEAALSLPGEVLREVSGRPVPTGSGPAALLASFVYGLAAHAPSAEARHAAWWGTAAVDLATAFLDSETAVLRGGTEPPPATARPAPSATDVLLRDIKTYIEHHLHDPDLSLTSIAAANHISLRYLHHLFQRDGRTVGAFLRERRLEHCRADLSDPAEAQRSVCEIARRWGFRDPAVFNRTFKSAYGVTPGRYREQRLQW